MLKKIIKLYHSSAGLFKKMSRQVYMGNVFEDIKAVKEEATNLSDNVNSSMGLIENHIASLKNAHTASTLYEGLDIVLAHLLSASKSANSIKSQYKKHTDQIANINLYIESVSSTNSDLRLHIEKESFDKANDLKHKLYLTALRVMQIPVFIFVTYYSVNMAVQFIGEKDLVIPRGLISIVPSGLEQNAQKVANSQEKSDNTNPKPSATPEAVKNTKSVTNSVTSAIPNTSP